MKKVIFILICLVTKNLFCSPVIKTSRKLVEDSVVLVKSHEGLKLKAYKDSKHWAICYGNTFYPDKTYVKRFDTATVEQCEYYIRYHIEHISLPLVTKNCSQASYRETVAAVSFAYNTNEAPCTNGKYDYDKAKRRTKAFSVKTGKIEPVKGLQNRRDKEQSYIKGNKNEAIGNKKNPR